jgi:hypothetical protein
MRASFKLNLMMQEQKQKESTKAAYLTKTLENMSLSDNFKEQVELEFEEIVILITQVEQRTREAFKDENRI